MRMVTLPCFTLEQLTEFDRKGGLDVWLLQFQYVGWRREHGLEPDRTRLNRWEQAWDRLGEELDRIPPG